MKYKTKADAVRMKKSGPFPHRHKVIKTQYMEMANYTMVTCWTIVYNKGKSL